MPLQIDSTSFIVQPTKTKGTMCNCIVILLATSRTPFHLGNQHDGSSGSHNLLLGNLGHILSLHDHGRTDLSVSEELEVAGVHQIHDGELREDRKRRSRARCGVTVVIDQG